MVVGKHGIEVEAPCSENDPMRRKLPPFRVERDIAETLLLSESVYGREEGVGMAGGREREGFCSGIQRAAGISGIVCTDIVCRDRNIVRCESITRLARGHVSKTMGCLAPPQL